MQCCPSFDLKPSQSPTAVARLAASWTTKRHVLSSAKLVALLRFGIRSTTGDYHDEQAKKASGRRAWRGARAPDYDGKIKEAAHLCAKPRARLAF